MWSQLALCLFVGLALASNNPAWKDNTEYVYQVRARTLASLHEVSNDYSGVLLKAKLIVKPKSDGVLDAKIVEPQYAPVHSKLAEGWATYIPDSQLSYKQLPISQKPFQIVLKNGAVRDLIVNKEIPNWEANIIKSIVSQLQLDTQAENLIPSHINVLAQEDSNTAVFKTMEETVTGVAETLYEIQHLPEYVLQTKPWLVPRPELRGNGKTFEVVKSKNYTRAEERPAYHFGFHSMDHFEPSENQMGQFFTRNSVSRAVITGTLQRFTVQSSVTYDEIVISPTMNDKQKGSVNSMLNVTLLTVQQPTEQFEALSNPIALGSLVYRFDKPYSSSNEVRPGQQYEHQIPTGSAESEGLYNGVSNNIRNKRESMLLRSGNFHYDSASSSAEEQYWQQDKPQLTEAPESPLLPLTVGYEGQSLKKTQNIIENARKLAQQIGQEMQQPKEISRKNTVSKFVILTSLLRIMDQNEMQQVASHLYTKQHEGAQGAAWTTYRDAVAQCGTGPALMCIQDWIKTNKIQGEEAASVVSTVAQATRQPTEEYMRSFYQMIKSQQIMEQTHLNETTLLAFTKLVHDVYVNKEESHSRFPVHSFGSFRSKAAQNAFNVKSFLTTEVIDYLTQQLNDAIANAETHKIHAYIRALGNVGHQQILEAFEPYLEGKKQCSQFQRVLMVVALDKLASNHAVVARSVLYKIYRNPSEFEQVRVAAVYQLMRTSPPADMLQRMATYTNADASEYVSSAVKSVIETAAELKGIESAKLRLAAQSAKPLLTTHKYGAQYSKGYLRSYFVDQINSYYKQSVHTYGAEDTILPKGIQYTLRGNFAGVHTRLINMHALVSSIDDLTNVLHYQTEEHQEHQQQKQSQRSEQQQWSVENIAKLLNMQTEQREQLEGALYLDMADFQKIISFDNHTIEMLPHVLREVEECLKTGKQFHHTKMVNTHELALAFPTEMGLPFIYTYDRPTLVRFEGKIRASANPQISNGNKFRKPQTVESEFEIRALVSGKSQSQLAFITPFDHQRYSAGYEKNFQVYVPLSGKIHLDVEKAQLKAEIKSEDKDTQLMEFSSWPYTAQNDIYTTEPKREIIRRQHPQKIHTAFGTKTTGIALQLDATLDRPMDVAWVYEKLQRHDLVSALLSPWVDENMQHTEITLRIDSGKSTTDKVVAQFGFQHKYQQRRQEDNSESADISKFEQISEEPMKRQTEFMRRAISDINSAHVRVYDAAFEFQGQQQIKYIVTVASAKSNIDPKGRVLVQMKKNGGQGKLHFYLSAKSHIPNTNGLDMTYAMKFDPTVTTQIQASIGQTYETATKIKAQIQFRKSEERQQYLMEQPEYYECQRQMQEGNRQLHACAKMTAISNLLDQFTIKADYQNMHPEVLNHTYKWYSLLRSALFPTVEENLLSTHSTGKDSLEIQGRLTGNLEHLDVYIRAKHSEAHIKNVRVSEWAQQLIVPHPVFHVRSRLMGYTFNYDVYRPYCVVDKQAAKTFDNKTYPAQLTNDWTVLLHYVPRRAVQHQTQQVTVQQQLKEQIENYAVLVRSSQGSQKEIKMMIQTPETQGKLVEINFKPSGNQQSPKLFINGEEVKYNNQEGTDIYKGYLQVYGLPNGEVKAELYKAFYVIYDGSRVKLTIVDDKFRDAVRGLCGTFTGEQQTDFLTPKNCILRYPEEFVATYTILEQGKQNQQITQLKERAEKGECYHRYVSYANVISSYDTGRMSSTTQYKPLSRGSCTKLQTQYVVEGDETCFTLKPIPVCKSGCQRRGTVSKNIPVHCVQSTGATDLWKNEIQKGASPDFSLKSQTRSIRMEVAQTCSS